MMSAKRQKGNDGMSQRTPNNLRASRPTRDDTSDDEDSYDPDEESDEEENLSSSSPRKVTFDTSANVSVATPAAPMRQYIPDFDSLPKSGVWVSPAPRRHVNFEQVVVRTTKCDICNKKIGSKTEYKVMQRCKDCNKQFCRACMPRLSVDTRHFPVLDQLVWDALTKPNERTRPLNNFKSNMYHQPRSEVKLSRPMTPAERLASSRDILPGTFKMTAIFAPPPSRPSRARQGKAASTKKSKQKRKLPPGYESDEVDAHFELDWEYIQSLPLADQRKAKKEAYQRNLLRKATLEVAEDDGDEFDLVSHPTRTPLPTAGSRQVKARSVATGRQCRSSTKSTSKSTSGPHTRVATTGDSENTTSEPLRNILDGLSRNRRVSQGSAQAQLLPEAEESFTDHSKGTTSIEDGSDYYQEELRVQSNADEEGYELDHYSNYE
ncbi:hypothetical protein SBOR_0440 [Sclerotinia borealis F-4128]|uniref:FYVE-type domain-containing protein n=1 Tax=Sclerotinia borealis (strain F-4128) TaxID=1432307 RepID=W9CQS1_SCLBF|nr:hypothetical protein SBOR_0440 [Sclerotinia borealis F-4128]